jgi:hyperosmotically inducible periplasmic protein
LITRFISLTLLLGLIILPVLAQKHPTDDELTDQVRVRLANDADVGGINISVDVHQGAVTLTGKVRNDKQRAKAEKVVKKVKGVTAVTNQLVVSPD